MEKTTFVVPESDSTFTGPQLELPASMGVETPFQYFKQFVMDNMPEGCKGSLKPAVAYILGWQIVTYIHMFMINDMRTWKGIYAWTLWTKIYILYTVFRALRETSCHLILVEKWVIGFKQKTNAKYNKSYSQENFCLLKNGGEHKQCLSVHESLFVAGTYSPWTLRSYSQCGWLISLNIQIMFT